MRHVQITILKFKYYVEFINYKNAPSKAFTHLVFTLKGALFILSADRANHIKY